MASDSPEVVFDDDNPEWTDADFARVRAASEILPAEKTLQQSLMRAALPGVSRGS